MEADVALVVDGEVGGEEVVGVLGVDAVGLAYGHGDGGMECCVVEGDRDRVTVRCGSEVPVNAGEM